MRSSISRARPRTYAARELPNLPLEDPLQLVHLYADRGSPRYEKAAIRWLKQYITEHSPKP